MSFSPILNQNLIPDLLKHMALPWGVARNGKYTIHGNGEIVLPLQATVYLKIHCPHIYYLYKQKGDSIIDTIEY